MEEEPIMEKQAAAAVEEEEQVLLPGFRFHPTDEELLGFYLRRKVQRRAFSIDLIREVDIYKHDPWDLPKASGGEREWYFFCLRGRKYRNSIRPNRVTGSGFWKATGIDRAVYGGRAGDVCIGLKKSLVYYRGSAGKGTKTDWMMHEFRLPPPSTTTTAATTNNNNISRSDRHSLQEAEIWTICRIFKRTSSFQKSESPENFNQKTNIVSNDSSSKASSFEFDLGPAFSGYPHEEVKSISSNNNNKYYEQNTSDKCCQNNEGQYLCNNYSFEQLSPAAAAAAAEPLYCEIAPAATTASCEMNDWFNDGNWDELERIVEFMNDQSVAYQYQYY